MDLPEYSNVVCWWGGASCPSPELLGDCPQTLTRVLPLDATGYFRPQTNTFVPTPRKYKIQWGWHGDGVEDEQHCRGFRRQCRGFWRHCRWCWRGLRQSARKHVPRIYIVECIKHFTFVNSREDKCNMMFKQQRGRMKGGRMFGHRLSVMNMSKLRVMPALKHGYSKYIHLYSPRG